MNDNGLKLLPGPSREDRFHSLPTTNKKIDLDNFARMLRTLADALLLRSGHLRVRARSWLTYWGKSLSEQVHEEAATAKLAGVSERRGVSPHCPNRRA